VKDAAWYYPEPKDKAKNIKDYVAFCELDLFLGSFSEGCLNVICQTSPKSRSPPARMLGSSE